MKQFQAEVDIAYLIVNWQCRVIYGRTVACWLLDYANCYVEVLATEVQIFLLRHYEVWIFWIVVLVDAYFGLASDNLAESQNKITLVRLTLQLIDTFEFWILLQKLNHLQVEFLAYLLVRRADNILVGLVVAKQLDRGIHLILQVAEAYNLAKTLLLVQHSVSSAESLQQTVIFKILIYIKRVELFSIEAREEHTYNQQKVERLHILLALLHSLVNIIVVCAEIICREGCAEHLVVIIDDHLQLVRCYILVGKALSHTSQLVILATISCVCKYSTYFDIRFKRLEYLVVFQQHRNRLNSKQCIEVAIESRFFVVVENKLRNFCHTTLRLQIDIALSLIVLNKEAEDILICDGILNHILV